MLEDACLVMTRRHACALYKLYFANTNTSLFPLNKGYKSKVVLIILVLEFGEQTNWSPAVEMWLINGKPMKSCTLHPVQLLPAGWNSICLCLWHRIKGTSAGDSPFAHNYVSSNFAGQGDS